MSARSDLVAENATTIRSAFVESSTSKTDSSFPRVLRSARASAGTSPAFVRSSGSHLSSFRLAIRNSDTGRCLGVVQAQVKGISEVLSLAQRQLFLRVPRWPQDHPSPRAREPLHSVCEEKASAVAAQVSRDDISSSHHASRRQSAEELRLLPQGQPPENLEAVQWLSGCHCRT